MAQIVALIPDLLFGSAVVGALQAGGHQVTLVSDLARLDRRATELLVVDLTADPGQRVELVRAAALPAGVKVLAFYAHVETDVRALAEEAGFDLVVPRSRMAREGASLVSRLVEG